MIRFSLAALTTTWAVPALAHPGAHDGVHDLRQVASHLLNSPYHIALFAAAGLAGYAGYRLLRRARRATVSKTR